MQLFEVLQGLSTNVGHCTLSYIIHRSLRALEIGWIPKLSQVHN